MSIEIREVIIRAHVGESKPAPPCLDPLAEQKLKAEILGQCERLIREALQETSER
jgi:hypothetical protein